LPQTPLQKSAVHQARSVLQSPILPAMMIDADKDHGNCARTRRRERAATPGAHWSRHLAAHVPGVKAS
jgi:hypothetical protein